MQAHILLAIDDTNVRTSVGDYLARNGYRTSTAASREVASRVEQGGSADLLVVDTAGCHEDVLRVCHAVRGVSGIPIIVLSSHDDSEERIRGFDAGADDYLVKPFNPRELVGRIKAVSRRVSLAQGVSSMAQLRGYRFGEWRLDILSRTLRHSDGSSQTLTATDFRLVEALVTHALELLPRKDVLQILHGSDWQRFESSIEARMSRMRKLLRSRELIRSVYGAGYLFASAVEPDYLLLPPGRDDNCDVR